MIEIFVKIDDVTGTGTGAHQGWLTALSAGPSSTLTNANRSMSAAEPGAFEVTISEHQSIPKLVKLATDGIYVGAVTIEFVKAGRVTHRITLASVVIGDFVILDRRSSDGLFMFRIMLHYEQLSMVHGIDPIANTAMTGVLAGVGQALRRR